MIAASSYVEMINKFGTDHAKLFNENNMAWMNCMISSKPIRYVMYLIYVHLLREGQLIKLEQLEEGEKRRLYSIIKEFAQCDYAKGDYISACKALYTLEYFLNLNE